MKIKINNFLFFYFFLKQTISDFFISFNESKTPPDNNNMS